MTKVLEKIGKIEDEIFDLKRELYRQSSDKRFNFCDDKKEIEDIVETVRKTRRKIWKENYECRV